MKFSYDLAGSIARKKPNANRVRLHEDLTGIPSSVWDADSSYLMVAEAQGVLFQLEPLAADDYSKMVLCQTQGRFPDVKFVQTNTFSAHAQTAWECGRISAAQATADKKLRAQQAVMGGGASAADQDFLGSGLGGLGGGTKAVPTGAAVDEIYRDRMNRAVAWTVLAEPEGRCVKHDMVLKGSKGQGDGEEYGRGSKGLGGGFGKRGSIGSSKGLGGRSESLARRRSVETGIGGSKRLARHA